MAVRAVAQALSVGACHASMLAIGDDPAGDTETPFRQRPHWPFLKDQIQVRMCR